MIITSLICCILMIGLSFALPALGCYWMLWITIPGAVLGLAETFIYFWLLRDTLKSVKKNKK